MTRDVGAALCNAAFAYAAIAAANAVDTAFWAAFSAADPAWIAALLIFFEEIQ
jgi:hypothetical protein